jgi:hypothetical protein
MLTFIRRTVMAEEMKMSGGNIGWNSINSVGAIAALASALGIGIPALVKANNAEDGTCGNGKCSENTLVNRYEMGQSQRIAMLESDRYTDQKIIEAYKQSVADNNALKAEIAALAERNSAAHETIYKELVAQREAQLVANAQFEKEIALNKQRDYYVEQLNNCRFVTAKKVVSKDDICPSVMPEFNSWTAPTTTTTAG